MIEENKIIESIRNNIITLISIVIMFISFCIVLSNIQQINKINYKTEPIINLIQSTTDLQEITGETKYNDIIERNYDKLSELNSKKIVYITIIIICIIAFVCSLIAVLLSANTSLVVTDKRVYGTIALGKRVDIPLKAISSIGTGFLQSIIVSSSSSKICFYGIANYKEIHKEISNLILSDK